MAGNSNIDAQVISKEIGNVMKRLLSEHHSFLTELKDADSSKGQRRAKKGTSGDSPSASMDINRRLTGSIKNLNKHVGISASMFDELNSSISKLKSSAEKSEDQNQDTREAQKRMYDQLALHINQSTNASKAMTDAMVANTTTVRTNTETTQQETRNTGKALSDFGKNLLKTFPIIAQLKNVLNDVRTSAARTNQFGFLGTPLQSISMGITEQELIALQGDNRITALRSSGGMEQFTQELKNSMRDIVAFTGMDIHEAHKVNAAMRTNLMNMGLTMSQATDVIGTGRDGLIGNLKHLANITGQTVDNINKTIGEIMSTDESRSILQRMGSEQRMDYLRTQGALYTQFLQMTGDEMKARQMLEQNNKDSSKTMVQRFVEAAKASQAALLTGAISQQESVELRGLLMKNPALRTEDERARLAQLGGQVNQRIQDMKGSGDLRTEFLADKMNELAPELNVYNTTTYNPLDDTAVARATELSAATKIDESVLLKGTLEGINRIEKVLKSTIFGVLGSIFGILLIRNRLFRGGIIKGARAMRPAVGRLPNWMQQMAPKAMRPGATPRIAPTPTSTTLGSTVANSATRAAPVGSIMDRARSTASAPITRVAPNTPPVPVTPAAARLTTLGRFANAGRAMTGVGAVAMVADYALDKMYTPESVQQEQGKNSASSALGGAALGATIGSFIMPGVGTAIGAALGGVTGAIYGYLKDTDSVEKYESRHNLSKSRALVQEIESRKMAETDVHNAKMSALRTELASTIERRNAAVDDITRHQLDNERAILEERLRASDKEHDARMRSLSNEADVASRTAALYEGLDQAIDTKENIGRAIEAATARSWSTILLSNDMRDRVSLDEYAAPTGMTSQDILADMMTKLGASTIESKIDRTILRNLIKGSVEDGRSISKASNKVAYELFQDYFNAVRVAAEQTEQRARTAVEDNRSKLDTSRAINDAITTLSSAPHRETNIIQTIPGFDHLSKIVADGNVITERDLQNITLTHEQRMAADVNNDGVTTSQEQLNMMVQILTTINETLRKTQSEEAQRDANRRMDTPLTRPNARSTHPRYNRY